MKLVVIIPILLAIVCLVLWLWGKSLPDTHEVTLSHEIEAPLDQVWKVLTGWEEQVKWRNDIKRVEIISPDVFIEYPKSGPPITFKIEKMEPQQHIELSMSGPFNGIYTANLLFNNGVTTITAYEKVTYNSVIGRIFSRLFFDLKTFANNYLYQLGEYAKNS